MYQTVPSTEAYLMRSKKYYMNIYASKEPEPHEGTLGETALKRSASIIQEEKDFLLDFATIGICLKNIKKCTQDDKLESGEAR
jgi:hypothetical protein